MLMGGRVGVAWLRRIGEYMYSIPGTVLVSFGLCSLRPTLVKITMAVAISAPRFPVVI
jgi:hypothetical protein